MINFMKKRENGNKVSGKFRTDGHLAIAMLHRSALLQTCCADVVTQFK
jgi:hypothetical protein